ncbi:hypothetical protein [Hydrogenimonas cancrithermarum]|uniref:Uncharacterized protein n=1 Tax=Hydrogenimonas cancrithermarum TaxID=2993563 RepID=A0ABN6WSB8_9BACT|nr:hypothetical protein [Hydrogenimonas cancrithermarum]BDY11853.1 hypothetical protein HCR_01650 [Hydrogenimonas cancrithermarum]
MQHTIKYVGPKPICSQHGVEFDHAKEDRFIFIETIIQLIEALDRETHEDATLHFSIKYHTLDSNLIMEKVRKYHPDIDKRIEKEIAEKERELSDEMKYVEENPFLSEREREAWMKNIRIMHDYVIQRLINKTVYHTLISTLAEELLKDRIRYIVLPMHGNFHHVAKTLSYALEHRSPPVSSHAEIVETKEGLALRFNVSAGVEASTPYFVMPAPVPTSS